ncbi:TPA: di-trans,poly-cis-decaprenylcistransferase [Candidatus Woesearchaeota archaeon]|nr:di-trans,poly-cis-decaprenylcistransferase [Candidatus Woesearchaeota archaeon]
MVNHIGIILDGNRRLAKRLMLQPWKGHEFGAQKVMKLVDWCSELDVNELTLYAFSMQNFNRPKQEFDYLMKLFVEFCNDEEMIRRLHRNQIRVNFIGRIHLFPEEVYVSMKRLIEETKDYSNHTINFAVAYGGREEIIDAVKKLGRDIESGKVDVSSINEETFENFLYMKSEPELIIRTGGDHRTSNFLAWQSTYSEWFFLQKFWPEFEKEDLVSVIDQFEKRERRFGK